MFEDDARDGVLMVPDELANATEGMVVEERLVMPGSESNVKRSPASVDTSLVLEDGTAVNIEMRPRVMVLDPLTTHSKLLLLAQGVESDVENSVYFNDAIGARLTTPEGVSTHSQVESLAQGVELEVQFCEPFTLPGGGLGVADAPPIPVVGAIGPSVVVLDEITKHARLVLPTQRVRFLAQFGGRFPVPGGETGVPVAASSPSICEMSPRVMVLVPFNTHS